MQRNIRKVVFFVGLPLAAIPLVLFVMSLGSGMTKVFATTDSSLNFSISSTGCDSDGTAKCNVFVGSSFSVAFNITSLPSNGNYDAYDGLLNFSGAISGPTAPAQVHQTGAGNWPDCTLHPTFFGPGQVQFGCLKGIAAPSSTYLGSLAHLDFACASSAGTGTITMVHSISGTTDSDLNSHTEGGADESLTVNCVQAPTPPVGGVSIDPQLPGSSGSDAGLLASVIAGGMAVAAALSGRVWYARRRRAR